MIQNSLIPPTSHPAPSSSSCSPPTPPLPASQLLSDNHSWVSVLVRGEHESRVTRFCPELTFFFSSLFPLRKAKQVRLAKLCLLGQDKDRVGRLGLGTRIRAGLGVGGHVAARTCHLHCPPEPTTQRHWFCSIGALSQGLRGRGHRIWSCFYFSTRGIILVQFPNILHQKTSTITH